MPSLFQKGDSKLLRAPTLLRRVSTILSFQQTHSFYHSAHIQVWYHDLSICSLLLLLRSLFLTLPIINAHMLDNVFCKVLKGAISKTVDLPHQIQKPKRCSIALSWSWEGNLAELKDRARKCNSFQQRLRPNQQCHKYKLRLLRGRV